jgi:ParB family chromosome partitioning protein
MNTTAIIENRIKLDLILPNPEQPRKVFEEGELLNLAASIREHDVISPIVVEQAGDSYILHDGERRVRAARLAGLQDIPAVVVPPLDGTGIQDRLTRAVVANVQRADMNPVEEAHAYQRMRDEFGWTPAKIARRTGVYPSRIYNLLFLVKLEMEIQQLIAAGKFGHEANMIRALLEIPDSRARVSLVKGLAIRKTTVKGCILAAKRLTEILNSKKSFREHSPAMAMAGRLSKMEPDQEPRRWNAMMELGSVPPWGMLSKVAFDTCEECELKSMASSAICGRCQLVDMLRKLMVASSGALRAASSSTLRVESK